MDLLKHLTKNVYYHDCLCHSQATSISLNFVTLLSKKVDFPFRPGLFFACNFAKTTKTIKPRIKILSKIFICKLLGIERFFKMGVHNAGFL